MIEIDQEIKDEAIIILQKGFDLPQQIKSAPAFFVATGDDKTIQAFGGLVYKGVSYKIGSKKPQ